MLSEKIEKFWRGNVRRVEAEIEAYIEEQFAIQQHL